MLTEVYAGSPRIPTIDTEEKPMPTVPQQLDQALQSIDRPGSFCVQGSVPAVVPGLDVAGLGPVGMPLTDAQAKQLKKLCVQAPYGKGEETVVDTSVRRVWRLTPDRFTLTNPDWQPFLQQTVATVQQGLGLEKQKLDCHLYDLLLYEPGSFFLPHRDGEKLPRMVATLVLVLPSTFEGGELVVRHDGQEQTIDFGSAGDRSFHIHYAAFYADCEHEIRPLRQGYRLCLVYNLTLAKGKKAPAAPRGSEHVERIGQVLRDWAQGGEPRKLAVLLDHQYTQGGLTWDALKGVDRTRARALLAAAGPAGCKAYLARLTLWESGSAEDDGGYQPRGRWYDDEDEEEDGDEEEDEEDEAGNYKMEEVFDTSLTAEHWSDSEGQGLPLGKLTVEEDEVVGAKALRAVKPEEEYEGYTGNEGMTLERWYRHGAIILWPQARHFEVLCDRDSRAVVPLWKQMVAQWQKARAKQAAGLKQQCLDLAAAILARWPENPYPSAHRGEEPDPGDVLTPLAALDDPKLIARFLGEVPIKDASVEPGQSLVSVCQKHGWTTFQQELVAVCRGTTEQTLERNVRLLEQVCAAKPRKKEGWNELCGVLAEELVLALEKVDGEKASYHWGARQAGRAEVLAGLARALIGTEQPALLSRVIAHALALPEKYPLTEVHVPALLSLQPWLKKHVKKHSAALSEWLAACRKQLAALTARMPQPPADFRRDAAVRCGCAECRELKQFLENPGEAEHRFSRREERRKHLEQEIRRHGCDLDLKTDRHGSPQTLVCTKNTASYQARLKKYHQHREHLALVEAIQAHLPS
jgi:hypothetical protein